MDVVNIAELKNRLSHYLRLVRRGKRILVRDRDRIVARIDPAGAAAGTEAGDAGRLADLEARGILRPGRGGLARSVLAGRPVVDVDVVGALLDEREEGR